MNKKKKQEMIQELERCKNNPVYFIEKYCVMKRADGKNYPVTLNEASREFLNQIAVFRKATIKIIRCRLGNRFVAYPKNEESKK